MRKFLSISCLFLYLISSLGLTLKAHYCGGDLASLSFFNKENCCCEENRNGRPDNCCKDEIKTIKILDDQLKDEQTQKQFISYDASDRLNSSSSFNLAHIFFYESVQASALPKAPDRTNILPAYKRNHSFLFYS